MQSVDREGVFRAVITGYGLKEMESGAVSIGLQVQLLEMFDFDTKEWTSWSEYDMHAEGDVWIVSGKDKGNKVNEMGANSLIKYAGWDGNFDTIAQQKWEPQQCQVVVKEEEWQNKKRFKIAFVNDWNRTPGGTLSNVDAAKAKELQARYGSQFRALAGNVKRETAPTSGKPTPPPRKPAPLAPSPDSDPNNIPF